MNPKPPPWTRYGDDAVTDLGAIVVVSGCALAGDKGPLPKGTPSAQAQRVQITFDYVDTDTGDVATGQIRQATRAVLPKWLGSGSRARRIRPPSARG